MAEIGESQNFPNNVFIGHRTSLLEVVEISSTLESSSLLSLSPLNSAGVDFTSEIDTEGNRSREEEGK